MIKGHLCSNNNGLFSEKAIRLEGRGGQWAPCCLKLFNLNSQITSGFLCGDLFMVLHFLNHHHRQFISNYACQQCKKEEVSVVQQGLVVFSHVVVTDCFPKQVVSTRAKSVKSDVWVNTGGVSGSFALPPHCTLRFCAFRHPRNTSHSLMCHLFRPSATKSGQCAGPPPLLG